MSKDGGDIVIKRIKKGHHGRHGGAWKIAYADFVTAMMAFFLLLWLLGNVPKDKLKSISEYFTPTIGLFGQMGIGFEGGTQASEEGTKKSDKTSSSIMLGAPTAGPIVTVPESVSKKFDRIDEKNFTSMQNDLYKAIHDNPELKEFAENILILQTPEGLKIELLDDDKRPMFKPGTTELMPYTLEILRVVAKFIRLLPNYISLNGHTNSVATSNGENWSLSALRADSARKFLVNGNIDPEQIYRIVGLGDQDPKDKDNLSAASNMRLSIILLKNALVPFQKRVTPDGISLEHSVDKALTPFQDH